jgi:hypothetical protein
MSPGESSLRNLDVIAALESLADALPP